ncbi:hypothetical protein JST97_23465 [bacterium]|nr:hypothetical protein [bacterium]
MLISDPFLYRSLRSGRQIRRQFLLALVGPVLLELPHQLSELLHGQLRQESASLGLLAFVTFLCIRAIAGSVGVIAQERERGSWEVLLSSGFQPQSIVLGLWRACLIPRLLEVTLTLPWLYLRVDNPLAEFAFLSGLAGFYTTLGLFASLRCGSALRAMQLAYGWLGLTGVGSFMLWLVGQIESSYKATCSNTVLMINPWAAVLNLESDFTQGAAALHGLMTLLLLLALSRQNLNVTRLRMNQGLRRPAQENPLRYRNQFQAPRTQWGLALLYCLLLLAPWYGWKGGDGDSRAALSMLAHLGFWLIRATYSCCHCFCREREQGSLDALLTTRLSPKEILSGLLSQTLVPLSWQALLLSPLLFISLTHDPKRLLLIEFMTQLTLWGWGFAAIAASLFFSSTLKAFQATYLWLAFITVGTLTLDVTLLDPLLRLNRPLLCMVNPVLSGIYLAFEESQRASDAWWPWCITACLTFHLSLIWLGRRFSLRRLGQP